MIELEKISPKSALISEELEGQLKGVLDKLDRELTLVCVLDMEDKASMEMAELVRHIAGLSQVLNCQFYDRTEAEQQFKELDTEWLPVTALYRTGQKPDREGYTGIAFHGVTGGKELNSLVFALYNTAGPGQEIEPKLQKDLWKLDKHIKVKVFVSLSCHHCAQQVITCQKIAAEASGVEVQMIDARLYPKLAEQYQIERIPMTVIEEQEVILGTKTTEQMYRILKKYNQ